MHWLFALIFLTFSSTLGCAAEITGGKWRTVGVGAYVNIIGPIVRGDSDRFRQVALALIKSGLRIVHVRTLGPGGDVAEAIGIGRQIRLLRAQTNAPKRFPADVSPNTNWCPIGNEFEHRQKALFYETKRHLGDANCNCTSACFLIWAAGIGRYGDVIGVHRPAFTDQSWFGSLSKDDAQSAYEQSIVASKNYLREMDISENIIAMMFSVSSTDMRYISSNDITLMDNYPQYNAEMFVARCGARPTYATPQFKAWSDCFGRNDKLAEFYQGSEQYVRQYGK